MILAFVLWNKEQPIAAVVCGLPDGAQVDWLSFAENARLCFEDDISSLAELERR